MKVKKLYDMVRDGKKPLVKLTNMFFDEAFGEKDMLVRVTGVGVNEFNEDGWMFMLDYMEHKERNLALQTPNWYENQTMTEAGEIKEDDLTERMYIDSKDSDVPMELVEDNPLLHEYLGLEAEMTYVEWLEEEITSLRYNAQKS